MLLGVGCACSRTITGVSWCRCTGKVLKIGFAVTVNDTEYVINADIGEGTVDPKNRFHKLFKQIQ